MHSKLWQPCRQPNGTFIPRKCIGADRWQYAATVYYGSKEACAKRCDQLNERDLGCGSDGPLTQERAGYILMMRLKQSNLVLDDTEEAACDLFRNLARGLPPSGKKEPS